MESAAAEGKQFGEVAAARFRERVGVAGVKPRQQTWWTNPDLTMIKPQPND
jgi:hypothetical protein